MTEGEKEEQGGSNMEHERWKFNLESSERTGLQRLSKIWVQGVSDSVTIEESIPDL